MYEVMGTISDEYGTRTGPTGEGSPSEAVAGEMMAALKRRYPEHRFHVEWVPSEDEWNAY